MADVSTSPVLLAGSEFAELLATRGRSLDQAEKNILVQQITGSRITLAAEGLSGEIVGFRNRQFVLRANRPDGSVDTFEIGLSVLRASSVSVHPRVHGILRGDFALPRPASLSERRASRAAKARDHQQRSQLSTRVASFRDFREMADESGDGMTLGDSIWDYDARSFQQDGKPVPLRSGRPPAIYIHQNSGLVLPYFLIDLREDPSRAANALFDHYQHVLLKGGRPAADLLKSAFRMADQVNGEETSRLVSKLADHMRSTQQGERDTRGEAIASGVKIEELDANARTTGPSSDALDQLERFSAWVVAGSAEEAQVARGLILLSLELAARTDRAFSIDANSALKEAVRDGIVVRDADDRFIYDGKTLSEKEALRLFVSGSSNYVPELGSHYSKHLRVIGLPASDELLQRLEVFRPAERPEVRSAFAVFAAAGTEDAVARHAATLDTDIAIYTDRNPKLLRALSHFAPSHSVIVADEGLKGLKGQLNVLAKSSRIILGYDPDNEYSDLLAEKAIRRGQLGSDGALITKDGLLEGPDFLSEVDAILDRHPSWHAMKLAENAAIFAGLSADSPLGRLAINYITFRDGISVDPSAADRASLVEAGGNLNDLEIMANSEDGRIALRNRGVSPTMIRALADSEAMSRARDSFSLVRSALPEGVVVVGRESVPDQLARSMGAADVLFVQAQNPGSFKTIDGIVSLIGDENVNLLPTLADRNAQLATELTRAGLPIAHVEGAAVPDLTADPDNPNDPALPKILILPDGHATTRHGPTGRPLPWTRVPVPSAVETITGDGRFAYRVALVDEGLSTERAVLSSIGLPVPADLVPISSKTVETIPLFVDDRDRNAARRAYLTYKFGNEAWSQLLTVARRAAAKGIPVEAPYIPYIKNDGTFSVERGNVQQRPGPSYVPAGKPYRDGEIAALVSEHKIGGETISFRISLMENDEGVMVYRHSSSEIDPKTGQPRILDEIPADAVNARIEAMRLDTLTVEAKRRAAEIAEGPLDFNGTIALGLEDRALEFKVDDDIVRPDGDFKRLTQDADIGSNVSLTGTTLAIYQSRDTGALHIVRSEVGVRDADRFTGYAVLEERTVSQDGDNAADALTARSRKEALDALRSEAARLETVRHFGEDRGNDPSHQVTLQWSVLDSDFVTEAKIAEGTYRVGMSRDEMTAYLVFQPAIGQTSKTDDSNHADLLVSIERQDGEEIEELTAFKKRAQSILHSTAKQHLDTETRAAVVMANRHAVVNAGGYVISAVPPVNTYFDRKIKTTLPSLPVHDRHSVDAAGTLAVGLSDIALVTQVSGGKKIARTVDALVRAKIDRGLLVGTAALTRDELTDPRVAGNLALTREAPVQAASVLGLSQSVPLDEVDSKTLSGRLVGDPAAVAHEMARVRSFILDSHLIQDRPESELHRRTPKLAGSQR